VVDTDSDIALGKVAYTIRHYNVIGVDSLPQQFTFKGINQDNEIEHGLGQIPDTFECVIEDGGIRKNVNSYVTLTLNAVAHGTDGGLRYHGTGSNVNLGKITADDTKIYITGPLPAGMDRIYTASVYS
jgi:hypothetical protein